MLYDTINNNKKIILKFKKNIRFKKTFGNIQIKIIILIIKDGKNKKKTNNYNDKK